MYKNLFQTLIGNSYVLKHELLLFYYSLVYQIVHLLYKYACPDRCPYNPVRDPRKNEFAATLMTWSVKNFNFLNFFNIFIFSLCIQTKYFSSASSIIYPHDNPSSTSFSSSSLLASYTLNSVSLPPVSLDKLYLLFCYYYFLFFFFDLPPLPRVSFLYLIFFLYLFCSITTLFIFIN